MDLVIWAVLALIVAVIAGGLGFSGLAAGAATAGRVLFGIFLLVAAVLFVLVLLGVGAAVDVAT